MVKDVDFRTVIDYGCGPGLLTESLAALVSPHTTVVGTDGRRETLQLNSVLRSDIRWLTLDQFWLEDFERPSLFVVDGVINFLTVDDARRLLSVEQGAFLLYFNSDPAAPAKPLAPSFDLDGLLEELGMEQKVLEIVRSTENGPQFTLSVLET